MLAVAAHPLVGALAWWAVAIGNTIAAVGMGYYLWRAHPRLRQELKEYGLSEEPADSPARADRQPVG